MARRRAAALLALAVLASAAPFPEAPALGPGAQVMLAMESSATVNASLSSQSIRLQGNITVDKPPMARVEVHLTCSNDAGWMCGCSPDEFFFYNTNTADFTCAMQVPAWTQDTVAGVTVHALCQGYGPTGEDYANATITVAGTFPANGTMEPAPGPRGFGSPIEKALGLGFPALALVATAIILPAAAAAVFLRRRRRVPAAPPPQ